MEQQAPQEFLLEAFADPSSVRDVVRGILHTIFFHRFFPGVAPHSRDVLDIALPYVEDQELDTMIERRTAELDRELQTTHSHQSSASASSGGGRGHLSVLFFEKKQRRSKPTSWYSRATTSSSAAPAADDEVCWERWTLKVTVAQPRTDSERAKVRKAMEQTLLTTVTKIVTSVNNYKDHIPPITTSETNPFPYQINVNQKDAGWATRMGIY